MTVAQKREKPKRSAKGLKYSFWILLMFLMQGMLSAQTLQDLSEYLKIHATASDPLYTTYSAAMARSRLYGDKAYKMDYYSGCRPVTYSSDHSGSIYALWKVDEVVILNTGEYFKKPVIEYSFPDMMVMEYEPFRGIRVRETFLVHSSTMAVVDLEIRNTDAVAHEITVYPVLDLGNDSLEIRGYNAAGDGYITHHYESPYRLISSLKTDYPYPLQMRDFFTAFPKVSSYGAYAGTMNEFYDRIKTDYYSDQRNDSLNRKEEGFADFVALQMKKRLRPGETTDFRYMRGVQSQKEEPDSLYAESSRLKRTFLKTYLEDNFLLYRNVPRIRFRTSAEKLVYLGSFNLVRGSMYPASGKTKYNFYSFSRNPIWGWGHGHQVLHESLSMLAYAYFDPLSAEGSQRVYMEQQDSSGLIAYRHGPRGMQDYPHRNRSTTSAPFFSWINWEIYSVSKDRQFLKESYLSGTKYLRWLIKNRDSDSDGTFEWGPNGIIENVRDWYNAVFQVSAERYLDVDKEDISDELECLDLTLMMIKEARCLSRMATVLGKAEESKSWSGFAEKTARLVNERMWDDSSSFYYSVNKNDHSFSFMTRDLRRQEIIGFLALWAGVAPKDRAEKLLSTLTDSTRFWRKYGVPTLSAKDAWYSPYVDYCCKWNGPVWLLWNYMVYEGLRDYGYTEISHRLAGKMMLCATTQLSKNHNFWESYSPDNEVLNCPPNYIWDSILARLLIEESVSKPEN